MTGKKMLILDKRTVDAIDRNRSDLAREEFVELCVDACIEQVEPEESEAGKSYYAPEPRFAPEEASIYATREEFQEFKYSIKELLRTFLDFFISFGLDLGTSRSSQDLENLKRQLRDIL